MTYRAVLTGTPTASTVELAFFIDQWTALTETIIVQSTGLSIDSTCPLVIVDRDSPECPLDLTNRSVSATSAAPSEENTPVVAGGVTGGLVGVISMVVLVTVVVVIATRCHKSKGKSTEDTE